MLTKNIVYYHRIDFDGRSAGALVRLFLESLGQTAKFIGIDYGEDIDYDLIDENTRVYMVDFTAAIQKAHKSYKAKPMYKINDLAGEFIWLDHHGSSLEDVENYEDKCGATFTGVRTTKFSGTELTWLWLFGSEELRAKFINLDLTPEDPEYLEEVPRIIYLLGRYDVWNKTHKDWEDIVAFQFGMRLMGELHPQDDKAFYNFWKPFIESTGGFADFERRTTEQGHVILEYNAIQNIDYIERHGYPCELYVPSSAENCNIKVDFTFFAMNTGHKGSASFDSLQGQYDAFIAYQHDGTKWRCSIYSFDTEKCNAQQLCIALGGGGHPGAAGFVWAEDQELPFRRIKES